MPEMGKCFLPYRVHIAKLIMSKATTDDKAMMKARDIPFHDIGIEDGSSGIVVEETKVITVIPSADLRRNMNVLTLIAFGFSNSSSWVALGLSAIIAIVQGGTTTLLYGTFLVSVAYACTGLTLAELVSVYPTAGGQYHFTSILAPKRVSKPLSYISGVVSLCAWFSTTAGTFLITAVVILALVIQFDPSYVPQRWHYFILYEVLNVLSVLYNIYIVKKSPRIFDVACKRREV